MPTAKTTPETLTTATMNIYQKLVKVRESVDSFSKDADTSTENNKKGYKYISGAQVLGKIKGKMDEFGVILRPNLSPDFKLEQFEYTDKWGNLKDKYQYTNLMTYTFINADDPEDRDEIQWFLTGIQDDPSKAFGSALTYSERYFLLKYFGVPTDDEDPDKSNNNDDKRQKNQPMNAREEGQKRKEQKEQKQEQKKTEVAPVPNELSKEINALWVLTGKNKDVWASALKTCGLKSKDEITEDVLFKLEATINELVDENSTGA